MELEFKLAWYTTVHFKFIIKNETVIFFDLKKKQRKFISVEISKKFKRAVVSLSKVCRSKIFLM